MRPESNEARDAVEGNLHVTRGGHNWRLFLTFKSNSPWACICLAMLGLFRDLSEKGHSSCLWGEDFTTPVPGRVMDTPTRHLSSPPNHSWVKKPHQAQSYLQLVPPSHPKFSLTRKTNYRSTWSHTDAQSVFSSFLYLSVGFNQVNCDLTVFTVTAEVQEQAAKKWQTKTCRRAFRSVYTQGGHGPSLLELEGQTFTLLLAGGSTGD